MTFHLGFELPERQGKVLDASSPRLTSGEVKIIKDQIRRNGRLIDDCLYRLDLFLNREGYPRRERFIAKIRDRLMLLMTENDTFRAVLWKHYQREEICGCVSSP